MSSSASASKVPYYIESRKDGNRITYVKTGGAIVTKRKSSKTKYMQCIVGDPLPGDNTYKLYVYETNANGDALPGKIFLDFNPHAQSTSVVSSESCTGPSQQWDLEEHENVPDAWLIKSCDGRFLKNNGSGKPISVYQTKRPKDRDDKSLHWCLTPVF